MRYAICNETFEGWDHERVCRVRRRPRLPAGWSWRRSPWRGRITDVTAERRRELRRQAEDCGLTLLGLHWLLAKTEGLHAHVARRRRPPGTRPITWSSWPAAAPTWAATLLVFGSPAQRRIPAGTTRAQATDYAVDTFRRARDRHRRPPASRLCLEPLAAAGSGLHQHLRRGRRHPRPHRSIRNFVLHLDVKAMSSEETPIARADPPPRRPHRPFPRQRSQPARPRFRRRRFRADLPGAAAIRLRRLGFGRGVRLLARPGDDRAGEPPLHARVRGAVWGRFVICLFAWQVTNPPHVLKPRLNGGQ